MGNRMETKSNIIKTTIALAKEIGVDNISVKRICDECQISKNTFYQYFKNKDDVFGETFASSNEEKLAAIPNILLSYDSALEQFWEILKFDINRDLNIGPRLLGYAAVMNMNHPDFNIENEDTLNSSLSIYIALVKKMQRQKEIRNLSEPFLLLKGVCCVFVGVDIRWSKTNGSFDFKKEIYDQVNAILLPVREIQNY